jgi:uncharacterized protein (TIGR03382 family)
MKQLAIVVCAVALVAGERARACGQCTEPFVVEPFGFRREPLPANANVFVSGAVDAASISVVGNVDGEAVDVPFAVSSPASADGSVYVSFQWTAAPGTVTIASNLGGNSYAIGPDADVVAPAAPAVGVVEGGRTDACCDNVAVTLDPTVGDDDDGTAPQVLVVRLSSAAGERTVHVPYTLSSVSIGASSACLQNDPLAVDGEAVEAVVSSVDWAGNASAGTSVSFVYRAFRLEDAVGCGFGDDEIGPFDCSQTGTSPWASLAVLALLRRRR